MFPFPRKNSITIRGFTLIEILVAVAIFAIIFTIGVTLFITSAKTQKMVVIATQMESDSRFSLESMAKTIRLGMIDYDYYANVRHIIPGNSISGDYLAMLDADLNLIVYRFDAPNYKLQVCSTNNCENNDDFQDITPTNIKVNNLQFYISPAQNPYETSTNGSYLSNSQPLVTIVMQPQGRGNGAEEKKTVYLQTTVSSRVYKR